MSVSNTPNLVYLVDLENVGTKLLCEHMRYEPYAQYIIFYSDSTPTPGSILEQIPVTSQVKFIDCRSGGNNAMDFCISAMAGRLTTDPRKVVRILSNDKGYDPMLRMLQEQGIRIKREKTIFQFESADTAQKQQEPVNTVGLTALIKEHVPKKYQNDVLNALRDVATRKEAHERLQTILPQQMAQDTYRMIRKFIPKEVA